MEGPERPQITKANVAQGCCGCMVLSIPLVGGLAASGILPWLTTLWAYIVGGTLAIIVFVMVLHAVGRGGWGEGG